MTETKPHVKEVKKGRYLRRVIAAVVFLLLLAGIVLAGLNRIVIEDSANRIITEAEAARLEGVDCILVLGAGVVGNKYPCDMLEDRLLEGVALYKAGVSDRILMSGDNSKANYNEVKVMKEFAVTAGVPAPNVFQDHAGFSTYESIYRARDVFVARKIVIVTQRYHLYRALYIARALGLNAYGVASDPREYGGQTYRDIREILARPKDVLYCVFKPLPKYLGDVIPVSGDGSVTDTD